MSTNFATLNFNTDSKNESFWLDLLNQALNAPTTFNQAFKAFHNYSTQNCVLAMVQCMWRDIPIGAINTFKGWQRLGRNVNKGAKAISLLMPVQVKASTNPDDETETKDRKKTIYVARNNWFVFAQTNGDEVTDQANEIDWNERHALFNLGITEEDFRLTEGNCLGYATGKKFAVNPLCERRTAVMFHEVAHIVLGHTKEDTTLIDSPTLNNSLQEVEAESVAHLLMLSLNAYDFDSKVITDSRGYIQRWLGTQTLPARSVKNILSATNKIIKAGQPDKVETEH